MNQTKEEDIRVAMLNSFLNCPHRDLDQLKGVHLDLQTKDPIFYSHLAAWYQKKGDIRDHKEVFIGALICDKFLPNREVGLALFRQVPVFLKRRVVGFIKGKEVKIRTKIDDKVNIEKKYVGLYKNIPTSFKNDIEKYLRYLESEDELFDSITIRSANDLKGLYASLRIAPSDRAQEILFNKNRPEDSRLNVFEQISKAENSTEIAKLIIKNNVPYTVAVGLVDKITPTILIALINSMSPQEIITNYASLEERGAMDNEDTKTLITGKLEKAKTAKNVSALKSKTAKSTGRVKNEEAKKVLDDIADTQIKKKGTLKIPTALFIDKSASMSKAIERGIEVATVLAGVSEAPLYVITFDTIAREIKAKSTGLTAWQKAFEGTESGGGTSVGAALDYLIRKEYYVEKIIVITDEGENNHPFFVNVLPKYQSKFNITPNITIIYIPSSLPYYNIAKQLSAMLKQNNIDFDYYKIPYIGTGKDKKVDTSYPGLVSMVSRNTKLDLLYEIMDTPLPERKAFGRKKK